MEMISFYKSVTCDDIGMLANSLTRVFGSIGFVHNFSPCLDKLSFVSQMYFLGYPWSQKGYKCYSHSLCHYLISADITFFGNNPPTPIPDFSISLDSLPHISFDYCLATSSPGFPTLPPPPPPYRCIIIALVHFPQLCLVLPMTLQL